MKHAINTLFFFLKNYGGGLNTTEKRYLKGEMEPIGKLAIKNTLNIGIIPSASKYVSIKLSDQCIHILNNNNRLNGLKRYKEMHKR